MNQSDDDVVRIRLDLGYDGTGFAGWARQPGLRTVQGVVEDALATVFRQPVGLTVAGRTDSGVHARGQVAHFDASTAALARLPGRSSRSPTDALVHRLSGVLAREASATGIGPRGASDVVVRRARPVVPEFDARFGALWRHYTYRIADTWHGRDPVRRTDVLWHGKRLDVEAMNEAARALVGEHDFAAFCKPRDGATTIRTVLDFSWARSGPLVMAQVRADAFCHSMVRSLVGASLAVGEGRRANEWPAQVLAAAVRDPAVAVAPAHGLALEEVAYPDDHHLAARTAMTRQVRTRKSEPDSPTVT